MAGQSARFGGGTRVVNVKQGGHPTWTVSRRSIPQWRREKQVSLGSRRLDRSDSAVEDSPHRPFLSKLDGSRMPSWPQSSSRRNRTDVSRATCSYVEGARLATGSADAASDAVAEGFVQAIARGDAIRWSPRTEEPQLAPASQACGAPYVIYGARDTLLVGTTTASHGGGWRLFARATDSGSH